MCPWNKFAKKTDEPDFRSRNHLDTATLAELFAWSEEEFLQRTEGSAIRRSGYERWLRNIAVALGNAPTSDATIAALESRRGEENPVVREHVEFERPTWIPAFAGTSAKTHAACAGIESLVCVSRLCRST